MDILKLLKKDHTEAKTLLRTINKLDEKSAKKISTLYRELRTAVLAHAKAEEFVLYKRLQQVDNDKTRILGFEGADEHEIAENLFHKLDSLSPGDEQWRAAFHVLKELLELHIKEEESEIFSKTKKFFDKDQLKELGNEFEARKDDMLESGNIDKPVYSTEEQNIGLQ